MCKLVLFYSFTGNTAKRARDFADANGMEIVEVKSAAEIGKFKAYTSGCFKAIKGQSMPIKPLSGNLSECSEVDVFAPVWAGGIAPPMNAALLQLAKGTRVSLHLVSASGKSNKDATVARIETLGLKVAKYEDLK